MYYIQRTDEFDGWLSRLKDLRAKAKIVARIRSVALGNLGDVQPVGEGLSELRIHYGSGYRILSKKVRFCFSSYAVVQRKPKERISKGQRLWLRNTRIF